ncbi:MAG: ribulose-phosphate 3-epimerase [Opitutales bacterium]|nr:ribulose-phosphate 3-epimerase [Opitutales bacterium]
MSHDLIVAPSILAGNHAHLLESAEVVAGAEADWIHLDIMDGHFVPNLTFGPQMLGDLRNGGIKLFFDTHLMLSRPDLYIEAFAKNGADLISIHIEPDYNVEETLQRIRDLGCQNGIVLNPGTDASAIESLIDQVDLVLVMTVQPGFGGQSFQHAQIEKMEQISSWRQERGLNFRLEVDGGVDRKTGLLCRDAGVDTFVAGSAFFKDSDKSSFLKAFAK